jgi:hypothetical protein
VDLIVLFPSDAGWISQSARHARVVARSTAPDALSALEPVVAALEGVSSSLWERFAQIDNTRFWDWLRTMANLLLRHPPDAAHHVLVTEAVSEGSLRGLTRVEPASGAVAVAGWLAGAATLWAEVMQREAADAVSDVPLLQPAHRPSSAVSWRRSRGTPTSVVEQLFHTAGPLRVRCALCDA